MSLSNIVHKQSDLPPAQKDTTDLNLGVNLRSI